MKKAGRFQKTLRIFIVSSLGSGILWAGFSAFAAAAGRTELKDENGDGFAETEYRYDGPLLVSAEVDGNKDKKPDMFFQYQQGLKARAEFDKDFDGTIDSWSTYNSKGQLWRTATDTNRDGKPDQFKEFPQGSREIVLKEYDRNFDGRIDRRVLSQWNGDKKIPLYTGGRMSSIPNPGYVTLWREEDENFDGLIDGYSSKADPDAVKVGQPIETRPSTAPEVKKEGEEDEGSAQKAKARSLAEIMNERHGL